MGSPPVSMGSLLVSTALMLSCWSMVTMSLQKNLWPSVHMVTPGSMWDLAFYSEKRKETFVSASLREWTVHVYRLRETTPARAILKYQPKPVRPVGHPTNRLVSILILLSTKILFTVTPFNWSVKSFRIRTYLLFTLPISFSCI